MQIFRPKLFHEIATLVSISKPSEPTLAGFDEESAAGSNDGQACPSHSARLAIPLFVALPPIALPRPDELPLTLPPGLRSPAEHVLSARSAGIGTADLLSLLDTAAAATLPAADQQATSPHALSSHDSYFRVRRYAGRQPAQAALHSVLTGYALFLREAVEGGSSLPSGRLAAIDSTLATMLALMLGHPSKGAALREAWPQTGTAPSALRRWIRGHQIFAVLTQGLIIAADLLAAQIAQASGDGASHAASSGAIETAVSNVVLFFEGSAGALCFTGDFPPAEYCGAIRATMAPPHVPDGFSGVLAADHRVLVNRLKAMRQHWTALRKRSASSHARLTEVLSSVYEDHKHVCARFVGTDRPSLLTVNGAEQTSSIEQLERFRKSRVRQLGTPTVAVLR